jgi:hypothetical protein
MTFGEELRQLRTRPALSTGDLGRRTGKAARKATD